MTDNVTIGKIVAPHGVRGDVRILPFTDFPDRFLNMKNVLLEDGSQLTIEKAKRHKQFILLKFKGIDDMDAAEKLRNLALQVKREDAVPLPEGSYYIFDIVGLSVYTEAGELLGKVTNVLETGSNDVYVVDRPDEKQALLIPALKKVVTNIDVSGGRIVVKLQEEWSE